METRTSRLAECIRIVPGGANDGILISKVVTPLSKRTLRSEARPIAEAVESRARRSLRSCASEARKVRQSTAQWLN